MQVVVQGRVDYPATYQAMQDFTAARDADTPDQLWLCEHPPVFTPQKTTVHGFYRNPVGARPPPLA